MRKKNVLEFVSKKRVSKKSEREKIIEEGKIGDLDYIVFSRGVLHIIDKEKNLRFKKDCYAFEDLINEIDLNLKEGDKTKIDGSGNNDDLIFTCKDGDIIISLEKKEYNTIKLLKDIIKKGKNKSKVAPENTK